MLALLAFALALGFGLIGCGGVKLGPFGVPSAPVRCGSDADCQHMAKSSIDPGWVCRPPYMGYPPGGYPAQTDSGLELAVCTPPPPGWVADSDPSYPPLPGMR